MSHVLFARAKLIVDGKSKYSVADVDRLLVALSASRGMYPEAQDWIDSLLEYRVIQSLEEGLR